MKNQRFRKLEVWERSISLTADIYKLTEKYPREEIYGITSQLRRAANSIALNIAEGSGSESDKDFCRHLTLSIKSSYEVMCALEISNKLTFCDKAEKEKMLGKCDEICAMLVGLQKKLRYNI